MSALNSNNSGPITQILHEKITQQLDPTVLEIHNDSHKHAHHSAMRGSTNITESHFRLLIVSDKFQNMNQPARHRLLYQLAKPEMEMPNGIHALQLTTKTPQEYQRLMEK